MKYGRLGSWLQHKRSRDDHAFWKWTLGSKPQALQSSTMVVQIPRPDSIPRVAPRYSTILIRLQLDPSTQAGRKGTPVEAKKGHPRYSGFPKKREPYACTRMPCLVLSLPIENTKIANNLWTGSVLRAAALIWVRYPALTYQNILFCFLHCTARSRISLNERAAVGYLDV